MWRRLLVVAPLVFVAVACGKAPAPVVAKAPKVTALGATATRFTGTGRKVAILGDSLTVAEWNALYDGLDHRHAVAIAAWFGEGYSPGPASRSFGAPLILKAAKTYSRSHPAAVVLALGTNDALTQSSSTFPNMATLVKEFQGACKVGITLPEHSTVAGWSNSTAHTINIAMRQWADQIVDWASISTRPGMVGADGIHTTPEGTEVRAKAIIAAIERCTK